MEKVIDTFRVTVLSNSFDLVRLVIEIIIRSVSLLTHLEYTQISVLLHIIDFQVELFVFTMRVYG